MRAAQEGGGACTVTQTLRLPACARAGARSAICLGAPAVQALAQLPSLELLVLHTGSDSSSGSSSSRSGGGGVTAQALLEALRLAGRRRGWGQGLEVQLDWLGPQDLAWLNAQLHREVHLRGVRVGPLSPTWEAV